MAQAVILGIGDWLDNKLAKSENTAWLGQSWCTFQRISSWRMMKCHVFLQHYVQRGLRKPRSRCVAAKKKEKKCY